uniref:Uncharacterized protein n=1 Tax=Sphaerodactylus townsendi TaxID=933632 RepID=A0ACB8GAM8_9SAUR
MAASSRQRFRIPPASARAQPESAGRLDLPAGSRKSTTRGSHLDPNKNSGELKTFKEQYEKNNCLLAEHHNQIESCIKEQEVAAVVSADHYSQGDMCKKSPLSSYAAAEALKMKVEAAAAVEQVEFTKKIEDLKMKAHRQ